MSEALSHTTPSGSIYPDFPLTPYAAPTPAGGKVGAQAGRTHLLTVALEDYYQTFPGLIQHAHWYRFERRVEQCTHRTLDLLDEFGLRATFFTLGWTAEKLPELVREVARRGHEIATKGYGERAVSDMASPDEFRDDIARARAAIESASGRRVVGFRAPEWIEPEDLWILRVLAEEGFAYDSSVKPLLRSYAGEPWRRFAHRNQFGDRTLWEFPISTVGVPGLLFPIGAGNYFRQLPPALMSQAVAYWDRTYPSPFMMYFHTWELDPDQPQITAAPLLKRVRVYRNLERVPDTLRHYFRRYAFTSVADHLGLSTAPALGPRVPAAKAATTPATGTAISSAAIAGVVAGVAAGAPIVDEAVDDEATASVAVTDEAVIDGASALASDGVPAGASGAARTRVTVVVPCYNEEITLPYLANTLESVMRSLADKYEFELVLVDDCSTDGTVESLHRIFGTRSDCLVLRHATNQGAARAILTGILAARTEIVCSIDCDCTYDPHELGQMIPLLGSGVDLVTGSPYHHNGTVRNVPGWRLALSRTASALYRMVLRQKLGTYTSFFRVHRRSAMLGVRVQRGGYLGIAEMLGRLDLAGATIVEYPTTLNVRVLGHSKMKVMRTIIGHVGLLAELALMRVRASRQGPANTNATRTPAPAGPQ